MSTGLVHVVGAVLQKSQCSVKGSLHLSLVQPFDMRIMLPLLHLHTFVFGETTFSGSIYATYPQTSYMA